MSATELKVTLRSVTWPYSFYPPYYSVSNKPFRTRSCDSYFLPAHVSLEQWLHGIKPVALSVHWDWINFREWNSINQVQRAQTKRKDETEFQRCCKGRPPETPAAICTVLVRTKLRKDVNMADSLLSIERATINQSRNGSKTYVTLKLLWNILTVVTDAISVFDENATRSEGFHFCRCTPVDKKI